MNRKANAIDTWFITLSSPQPVVDAITSALQAEAIYLQPFQNKTPLSSGIIFTHGSASYEHLISILQVQLKALGHRIMVINTSSQAFSPTDTLRILNYGAEYLYESSLLSNNFETISEKIKRWRNIESILQSSLVKKSIAGESLLLKRILRNVIEASVYSDTSVLILGERGTGKELIARLIHDISAASRGGELVLVDCTTIKTELSGSEFFGHEKGSYTGAERTREGAFALANNGTLFLDEVGEMPLPMQAELLRIIQEGAYKKIGSNTWRQTSFRLVCATNRNLDEEATQGTFRKDLNDRISLCKCYMPALNERKEDIPSLVSFFFARKFGDAMPVVDDAVIRYLSRRDYPGNIRELQNLVKRIILRYVGKGPITLGDIPEHDRILPVDTGDDNRYDQSSLIGFVTGALNNGYDAKMITDTVKALTTRIALTLTGSNKEVSQLLGKSERWIQLQKAKEK